MSSKFKEGDKIKDTLEKLHSGSFYTVEEVKLKNESYVLLNADNKRVFWYISATDNTCELATEMDLLLYL